MDKILQALPQGVQGEIHNRQSSSVSVTFANSEFENISNTKNQSSTLRLIKEGRMSMATSSKPGDEEEMLAKALATNPFGSKVAYDFPGAAQLQQIELVDPMVGQVTSHQMVDMADDLTQAILRYNPRVRVRASVRRAETTTSLANSNGFNGSYTSTSWSVSVGGRLVSGDDFLSAFDGLTSSSLVDDYEAIKAQVIRVFEMSKETVPFAAGSYPVIFAPPQVGHLGMPFMACLNGKAVVRNVSPWKERLGEQLLDPRVTVIDDGTLPMMPTSKPFDREGTPTRRNVLIENGVAKQFMLDLECAQALGMESTGNGGGGNPAPHHMMITPGERNWEDMVKQIDCGLLILDTMGAWTGNPFSGNVTGTISLGLKIEKGEIVGRVKDCMFSINSFTHFKDHIIDVSKDTKNIGQATFPFVALNEVVIAAK